jgi:sugar phosphate isomerase/epimerase
MQLRAVPPAHLTYCLNVHAGESLAQVMAAIRAHVPPIREAVCRDRPFGLGLRLANQAAHDLLVAPALQSFRDLLAQHNLYAFTINGFPYGEFHDAVVKERVYQPDWRTPARGDYTLRLARILAALLPESITGSISTVPGSYKAWLRTAGDVAAMTDNLADTAAGLDAIRRETGREIHLGLEPEPDCFLETTSECVAFFKQHLLISGRDRLARTLGVGPETAESILRRHIGICFDTCHLALQYEDLVTSMDALAHAGIRISKIQLSAAIRASWGPGVAEQLRPFCDPVYLHQVKAPGPTGPISRGDLVDALALPTGAHEEWRIHCHVPLYWTGSGALQTTADQLTPAFFRRAFALGIEHFEIETYTFDVLPPALRARGVDGSIMDEFRWVAAASHAR